VNFTLYSSMALLVLPPHTTGELVKNVAITLEWHINGQPLWTHVRCDDGIVLPKYGNGNSKFVLSGSSLWGPFGRIKALIVHEPHLVTLCW